MDDDLSPEADRWLDEAGDEFNDKQAVLQKDWLRRFDGWAFDRGTGVLTLTHKDGSRSVASAEVLGSFSSGDKTWEWAWNSAHMPAALSRKSLLLKEIGERFGLEFLTHGVVPIARDHEEMLSYLCSIGVKATHAAGIFLGGDERVRGGYFLLFDPRLAAS